MGYPPPPPPPGSPGGYGPPPGPPGAPGYGPPTGPPPGAPGGPPGYGGPPPGPGGPGGYGPPPGYGGPPPGSGSGSSGSSKGPLIALMGALVVVVLLAVVGGLILATRGGDEDVELTEAQLQDALVTEADVGEGFTVDEDSDDDESDDFDRDEIDASEECVDLYERFAELEEQAGPTVEANVTFEGEDGSQVEQNLSQGSEFGFDELRELVDTCPEISVDDGESVGTLRFELVDDVVEVGDESVTLQLEIELQEPFDISVTTLSVLWERDGTQASVNVSGAIDEETFESSEPDEGLLRDVVERADERLAEVIDEA